MNKTLSILISLAFVCCNPVDTSSKNDDTKYDNELTYPDSSILGKTYHYDKLTSLFEGFKGITGGTFPAEHNQNYQISQSGNDNESYVSLLRVTKEGGADFKLLDTLHFTNYENEKLTFSYWNCKRNNNDNGGTIVGLFFKSNEKMLTNPIKVWNVDLSKGVFVETSTDGVKCENRGYEFLQQRSKQ